MDHSILREIEDEFDAAGIDVDLNYGRLVAGHVSPKDESSGGRGLRELLFSRMKSILRLHQLPFSEDHIVRALIWASLLAVPCSNVLVELMRRLSPRDGSSHPNGWTPCSGILRTGFCGRLSLTVGTTNSDDST